MFETQINLSVCLIKGIKPKATLTVDIITAPTSAMAPAAPVFICTMFAVKAVHL